MATPKMDQLEHSLRNNNYTYDYDPHPEEPFPDDRHILLTTTFVSASLMSAFCLSGLYGNFMSALIFLHPSMKAPINVLLTALSCVDFALLFLAIPVFIVPSFNVLIGDSTLRRVYQFSSLGLYPLNMTAHTSSIWTFVLISIERYLAVCQPLNRHKLLTYREAKYAQIIVIVAALFYNLVRFWEYKPTSERTGIEALLRENEFYFAFYYTSLYFLTHFAAPFTIILVLNFCIVRSLRQSSSTAYHQYAPGRAIGVGVSNSSLFRRDQPQQQQQQEQHHKFQPVASQSSQFDIGQRRVAHHSVHHIQQQQRKVTLMIVVITFMFAGCNAPSFALNVVETLYPSLFTGRWRSLAYIALDLSNLLILLNSTLTFLVYAAFCRRYRALFGAYAKMGCWCLRGRGRLALRRIDEQRRNTLFANGQLATGQGSTVGATGTATAAVAGERTLGDENGRRFLNMVGGETRGGGGRKYSEMTYHHQSAMTRISLLLGESQRGYL